MTELPETREVLRPAGEPGTGPSNVPPVEETDPVRIGRFQVKRRVGAGGIGVVYEARDPELDRSVAIKVLRGSPDELGHRDERLRREAQAMARLSHVNVVPVFEVGRYGGQTYLAMELVDGQTLRKWKNASARSWRQIIKVYLQAGRGLAAAHRAGMIHRDFKPDNALVGVDGVVRVLDFGLVGTIDPGSSIQGIKPSPSTSIDTSNSLTLAGVVIGTPPYMSPEQLAGEPIDARTDQFSFCVALWEALAGHRPFSGSRIEQLEDAMRAGPPPRPLGLGPWRLETLLRKGLAFRAEDRHPDMDLLLAELERCTRSSTPRAVVAGLAIAAAGLGGAWAWTWEGRDPQTPETSARRKAPPADRPVGPPTSETIELELELERGRRLAGPTWRAFAIAGRDWVLATDGHATWWEDADGSNRAPTERVVPVTPTGDGTQAVVEVPDGLAVLDREEGIVRTFPFPPGARRRGHVASGGHHFVYTRDDSVRTLDLRTGEDRRRFTLAQVELPDLDLADSLPGREVVWSPDGQWLALQVTQIVDGESRTRVIATRPDGSAARVLAQSGPGPSDPCLAWLEQGIVLAERTWSAGALFVQPLADEPDGPRAVGERQQVLRDQSVQLTCYPTREPDGLIVVSSPERADERQYVAAIGDAGVLGNVRPLAARSTSSPVAWLDDEAYAIAARSGDSRQLFRGSLGSTELVPLFDGMSEADALFAVPWSAPGTAPQLLVWEEQPGRLDLVRRALDSGSSTPVLDWGRPAGLASGRTPKLACTAEGRCVLATRLDPRTVRVERFDPRDGHRTPAVEASLMGMVHWMEVGALSPDANAFATAVYGPQLEIVDLDDGAVQTIPYQGPLELVRAQTVTWSIDGERLFVTGRSKDFNVIWAVDPRSGRWTEAHHAAEDWFCSPRVAPDGRHLAFTVLDIRATLWIAQLEGR